MRVDHRGAYIFVTQVFLDSANVIAILKQVSCEGMSESVATRWLGNSCVPHGLFHRFLQHGFVKMMPPPFSCYLVDVMASGRKHPLPSPLFACVWVLAFKSVGQSDSAQASRKIMLVLSFYQIKVLGKRFFHCCGKHRVPILEVDHEEKAVTVLAIGVKEGNRLFISGEEFKL
jgi:hypothetical protein